MAMRAAPIKPPAAGMAPGTAAPELVAAAEALLLAEETLELTELWSELWAPETLLALLEREEAAEPVAVAA